MATVLDLSNVLILSSVSMICTYFVLDFVKLVLKLDCAIVNYYFSSHIKKPTSCIKISQRVKLKEKYFKLVRHTFNEINKNHVQQNAINTNFVKTSGLLTGIIPLNWLNFTFSMALTLG